MLFSRLTVVAIAMGTALAPAYADFTYQETTRMTGGSLMSMMKFAGAFSKSARQSTEPTQATVSIRGNRMVRKEPATGSIVDIDNETITTVDYARKSYTVMTFAQMKEAMEQMTEKLGKNGGAQTADLQFDVKLDDTGNTKSINGREAHEIVMTLTMKGSDAQSGAKGGMDMTTDMWIAPHVEGYQEVREFYKRMGEKMAWAPDINQTMASRPDISRAMAKMYQEGSKMDGMPVMDIIKMSGRLEGMPTSDTRQQSQQSQASAPPPASIGGALGGMLAGRMAKRKQADDAASNGPASGSLMEMTKEVTSFSTAPADPSLFEIPANFKRVESVRKR